MLLDTRNDVPPPGQEIKTFIALRPPRPIAEQLHERAAQLCARAGIVGSRRPSFILHVTLLLIATHRGRLPRMVLEEIDRVVSMVRFPAFDIVLDEAASFETRKDRVPFVIEGDETTDIWALHLAILNAFRVKGFAVPLGPHYTPHMTLAYARRRSPRLNVEAFSWTARDFQLIESWQGRTKYVELARWNLREDEPYQADSPCRPSCYQNEGGEVVLPT